MDRLKILFPDVPEQLLQNAYMSLQPRDLVAYIEKVPVHMRRRVMNFFVVAVESCQNSPFAQLCLQYNETMRNVTELEKQLEVLATKINRELASTDTDLGIQGVQEFVPPFSQGSGSTASVNMDLAKLLASRSAIERKLGESRTLAEELDRKFVAQAVSEVLTLDHSRGFLPVGAGGPSGGGPNMSGLTFGGPNMGNTRGQTSGGPQLLPLLPPATTTAETSTTHDDANEETGMMGVMTPKSVGLPDYSSTNGGGPMMSDF